MRAYSVLDGLSLAAVSLPAPTYSTYVVVEGHCGAAHGEEEHVEQPELALAAAAITASRTTTSRNQFYTRGLPVAHVTPKKVLATFWKQFAFSV